MVRQEEGRTILTGVTARNFIRQTLHPDAEAQERFNAFLQETSNEGITYHEDGFSAQIPGLTAPKWPERRNFSFSIPIDKPDEPGTSDWNMSLQAEVSISASFVFRVPYDEAVTDNRKAPYIEEDATTVCPLLPHVA